MSVEPAGIGSRRWIYAALGVVLVATLTPQPALGVRPDFFAPLQPNRISALRDVVQNILLYLPFGALLGLRGVSWGRVAGMALPVALTIELLQLVVPGRDPIAVDVLSNTTGAVAGWAITRSRVGLVAGRLLRAFERLLVIATHPSPATASALSLCWSVLVSALVAATCWLLSPALPPPFFYAVASPAIDAPRGPVRIGGRGGFSGLIDEVRIYSRAREADEILADIGRAVSATGSPDPSLVAAYGFDSDEGDAALDAAVPGRRATVSGASWRADGRFTGALAFDGRASEVVLPALSALEAPQAITLEAWVYPDAQADGEAPIVSLAGDVYYLRASADLGVRVPSAGGRFGAVFKSVRARRRISPGRWTHLASTFDGRIIRLYVDGRLAGSHVHWSSHHPVRASLDGLDLPFGSVAGPSGFRSRLSGPFVLNTLIQCGTVQEAPAPVFLVGGIQSIDVLSLEAAGSELRVRFPTWARRLGLASADHRISGVFSACSPGETLSLALAGPLQQPRFDVDGRAVPVALPGLGSGWTMLTDSQVMPITIVAMLSACYLGILIFPFGFWARASAPSVVGSVILLGGLYLVPGLWMMRPLDLAGSVAVGMGLVLGVIASRRRGR